MRDVVRRHPVKTCSLLMVGTLAVILAAHCTASWLVGPKERPRPELAPTSFGPDGRVFYVDPDSGQGRWMPREQAFLRWAADHHALIQRWGITIEVKPKADKSPLVDPTNPVDLSILGASM